MRRILIIGAGQAGSQVAVNLRERGFEGEITVVGTEPEWPYQRPPLSKAFLAGAADRESLELRDPEFYARERITIHRDTTVASIDPATHTARLQDGTLVAWDGLALTTGSRVRPISVPGADLAGVCYLRDVRDADELKLRLPDAAAVVVVGGGFIGLEAAAVAAAQGKRVTVVEAFERLMARAVCPETSDFYAAAHRRRGVDVRLATGVVEFTGRDGNVTGVRLADGSVVDADLVIVGIGVIPNAELAADAGINTTPGGIVVDRYARTSHPDVVAAGDCAILPHPLGGDAMVRLESVQNAVEQANTAAATLLGLQEPYAKVPWFWSDQADLKLQIAGLSLGYDEVIVRGEPQSEKFSVLYYRGEQLLAIDSVNHPAEYLTVRKMLAAGRNLTKDAARDLQTPLKQHAG